MKKVKNNEVLYHIGLSPDMVENAEYAVMINEKKYVDPIARTLDPKARYITENREFYSCLASIDGKKVLVVSTGLGGPPMAIGIEELAMIGLRYFVRLGETLAIQPGMKIGDLILSKAAVRYDGASKHYAPENYPAVASLEMTNVFYKVLTENNLSFQLGVTVTTDTFWPALERYDGYLRYTPKKFQNMLKEWKQLNVLSADMELSTLFTLCNVFDLEAVAILDVVNTNAESDKGFCLDDAMRIKNWGAFLKEALREDMKRERIRNAC